MAIYIYIKSNALSSFSSFSLCSFLLAALYLVGVNLNLLLNTDENTSGFLYPQKLAISSTEWFVNVSNSAALVILKLDK